MTSKPSTEKLNIADYKTNVPPIWCAGCGDFGVLTCMYRMLVARQIPRENTVIVSGIGCSGRLPAYVNAYGFHTVHGRVLPVATGIKTANPKLEVLAVGGDGDAYSIGAGHIPHAARRNIDICYIVMDNEVYGLTKGQGSATAPTEMIKGTTPFGQQDDPLNPIAMSIAYDISFVARGYSGKPKELTELIIQGVEHNGFALLEILSPCTTFHNIYKPTSQSIRFIDESHDPYDKIAAMKLAFEKDAIPLGVFYKSNRPSFHERIAETQKRAQASKVGDLDELIDSLQ